MKGLLALLSVAVLLGNSYGYPNGSRDNSSQPGNTSGSNGTLALSTQTTDLSKSQTEANGAGDLGTGLNSSAANLSNAAGQSLNSSLQSTDQNLPHPDLTSQNSSTDASLSSTGAPRGLKATSPSPVDGLNSSMASTYQSSNSQGGAITTGQMNPPSLNTTQDTSNVKDYSGGFGGSTSLNDTQGTAVSTDFGGSTSNSSLSSTKYSAHPSNFANSTHDYHIDSSTSGLSNSTVIVDTHSSLNSIITKNSSSLASHNATSSLYSSSVHEHYYMDKKMDWKSKDLKVYDENKEAVYIVASKGSKNDEFVIKSATTGEVEFSANVTSFDCGHSQTYVAQDGSTFKIDPRSVLSDRWYISGGQLENVVYEMRRKARKMAGHVYSPSGRVVADIGHHVQTKENDSYASASISNARNASTSSLSTSLAVAPEKLVPNPTNETSMNATSNFGAQKAFNATSSVGAETYKATLNLNSSIDTQGNAVVLNTTGPAGLSGNKTLMSTGVSNLYDNSTSFKTHPGSQKSVEVKTASENHDSGNMIVIGSDGTIPARYLIALMVIGKERIAACGY